MWQRAAVLGGRKFCVTSTLSPFHHASQPLRVKNSVENVHKQYPEQLEIPPKVRDTALCSDSHDSV